MYILELRHGPMRTVLYWTVQCRPSHHPQWVATCCIDIIFLFCARPQEIIKPVQLKAWLQLEPNVQCICARKQSCLLSSAQWAPTAIVDPIKHCRAPSEDFAAHSSSCTCSHLTRLLIHISRQPDQSTPSACVPIALLSVFSTLFTRSQTD